MLHTATLILCWTAIAVLLQRADGMPLAAIAALALAACAGFASLHRFGRMLRRSRWLLLAVVLLHLLPAVMAGPGWESAAVAAGALAGIQQALRLAVLLALLAIVLARRTREELLSGIHALMAPLAWLGVDRARFAARLCLTLEYFEEPAAPAGGRGVAAALTEIDREPEDAGRVIALPAARFGVADRMAMSGIALTLGAALL